MTNNDTFIAGDNIRVTRRGKRGVFTADFNHGALHRRRSLKTTNRKEAERRAWALHEKLRAGTCQAPIKSVPLDVGLRLYMEYLRAEDRSPKTLVKYKGELRRVVAFMTSKHVSTPDQITPLLYDEYRTFRKDHDNLAAYTAWNLAIVAKQWLRFLLGRKAIAVNPLGDLSLRKPRRNRHPATTSEQVSAILRQLFGSYYALVATLAFTGMRLGEALQLRVEHISLAGGIISLTPDMKLKTENASRKIPIHPRLAAILSAIIAGRTSGVVFQNSRGKPWDPRRVNVLFKQVAGQLGYTVGRKTLGLTVHSLRRFFKTTALDAGVPAPLANRWMGHADHSIDFHYYDPQKQQQWMERLPFGNASADDLRHIQE